MTIPQNSSAQVSLKIDASKKISISKNGKKLNGNAVKNLETGKFELQEGSYVILVSTK